MTDGAIATAVATVAVCPSPASSATCVAASEVPVAHKVTGLPARPPALVASELAPTALPRVHDVAAAMPLASVITGVVGLTVPPPDVTANVTATPATGLLN